MPNRPAFGALIAALAFLTASGASSFAQFAAEPRGIRIGIPALPAEIEPGAALEGAGPLIERQIFDTLVAYRPASTDVEPSLATRWTVSREGLVWRFILRDNVRFHDGKALTAADVVASLERPLKIGTRPAAAVWSALLRGAPGVVKEIRAADARTVQITITQPYAPLLTVLAHPGFGVTREIAASAGGRPRLVGTGPNRLAELSGGRVVLEAFADHWAGPPRTERLIFLNVPDDDRAEAELDAQGLDIWFPPGPPRRTQGALSIPGPQVGYLAFQTEREPFSRKKIRQAIAAAIDPAVLGAALGPAAVPLQVALAVELLRAALELELARREERAALAVDQAQLLAADHRAVLRHVPAHEPPRGVLVVAGARRPGREAQRQRGRAHVPSKSFHHGASS